MTALAEGVLGCLALLLLVPVTVVSVEVLLASTRRRHQDPDPQGIRPRLAVLMPAHNEASVIAATIQSVLPQLSTSDRLLVVADNCSDETSAIASAAGAEVLERMDTRRRGKGYALDFGLRHLSADAPDVVVIVDADCQVGTGAVARLAHQCVRSGRPAQALYLMHPGSDAGLRMRIAEFAWVVKNQVRPLGLLTLGLPCQLMGTGMAFPWSCLATATLATGHIVEDLKLGVDLARAGTPPLFCPNALIASEFPVSREGIRAQRTRWEHGHLGIILSEAPGLFVDALVHANPGLLALALDISVPPLALLTLQTFAVWFASVLLFAFRAAAFPLWVASAALGMLVVSVFACWIRYGRHIISFGDLALAVVYALSKVGLYSRFLVARQKEWVRSKREHDES